MEAIVQEVLSLLTEDYYGPWEIAVQVPVSREALKKTIDELLGSGLVAWFVRENDSAEAMPADDAMEPPDLSDDAAWSPPRLDERHWLLAATAAGEREYFGTG